MKFDNLCKLVLESTDSEINIHSQVKNPEVSLTNQEQTMFDWAIEGLDAALNDAYFVEDNPDCDQLSFQLDDIHERLLEQLPTVMKGDLSPEQTRGQMRVLNSLVKKLNAIKYFGE